MATPLTTVQWSSHVHVDDRLYCDVMTRNMNFIDNSATLLQTEW